MKSDIIPFLLGVANRDIGGMEIEWHDRAAVCVVMAAEGYPADYRKGDEISGLEDAAKIGELVVFHAGTAVKKGKTVTAGGRVLGVTALGATVKEAIDRAYRGVAAITWKGVHYRRDIGGKALKRSR
jgi:phosphoribosylamine--glycine ligase